MIQVYQKIAGYLIKEGSDFMLCRVLFHWDSEAKVWTATSEDVPGLVLESSSFDNLVSRVRLAIPELIDLNGEVLDK